MYTRRTHSSIRVGYDRTLRARDLVSNRGWCGNEAVDRYTRVHIGGETMQDSEVAPLPRVRLAEGRCGGR